MIDDIARSIDAFPERRRLLPVYANSFNTMLSAHVLILFVSVSDVLLHGLMPYLRDNK